MTKYANRMSANHDTEYKKVTKKKKQKIHHEKHKL